MPTAQLATVRPPPVSAQVYRVEGTVQYAARPPAGLSKPTWARMLKRALGVRSTAFVSASLDRLLAATKLPGNIIPTSTSLSAALALIEAMEPENELQAALAVDVAALHAASTAMLARVSTAIPDRRMVYAANAASRLERAFHSAVATYYRVKRGNTQVIRIEKIEIQAGAKAIVGAVQSGARSP